MALPQRHRRWLDRALPWAVGALVLGIAGALQQIWWAQNGLPDGHQNEYLHVGNAMDLWQAWAQHDWGTLGGLLRGNYWPPGFYLWPWPLFRALGDTHRAMVASNLGHLALLLASAYWLGRDLGSRRAGLWAMPAMLVIPAVMGNLVRYEPSVALTAWTTFGAWALLRSRGLAHTRHSLLFALALGGGLMMDRLSVAFFLVPPLLVEWGLALRDPLRRKLSLRNGALVAALLLICVGWWHWDFFQIHLHELTSQTGTGEIDAAGTQTEARSRTEWTTWAWYLLALLDGQLGLILGAAGLVGLGLASREPKRLRVPLLVVWGSLALFTLILKKQNFYSLPMLGCLAVLVTDALSHFRWGWALGLGLLGVGGVQMSARMWGRDPGLPGAGAEALPLAWVAPRHPMALPPRGLELPVNALSQELQGAQEIVVFGEDHTWYEGYVVLGLRERLPSARVRGVIGDPVGTAEVSGNATHIVVVRENATSADYPSRAEVVALMQKHHVDAEAYPLTLEAFEQAQMYLRAVWTHPLQEGGKVVVWERLPLE